MLRTLLSLALATFGCAYFYQRPPPFWHYPYWDEQGLVRYSFDHPYRHRYDPYRDWYRRGRAPYVPRRPPTPYYRHHYY